jgi:hypothetical protein
MPYRGHLTGLVHSYAPDVSHTALELIILWVLIYNGKKFLKYFSISEEQGHLLFQTDGESSALVGSSVLLGLGEDVDAFDTANSIG